MVCPCKGCENAGCGSFHDQCEKYQEWVQKQQAAKRKKYAEEIEERRNRRNRSCW